MAAAEIRPALGEAARRRGLIVMLIDTFLMWGGFFMVIPLISIHYVDGLGWAAGSIGLVLALRQASQQSLTLVGGALADRLGARGLIGIGMAIRTISFVVLAWADTYPLLMLSALLAAVGGALFDSPSSAAIAALTTPEDRTRYFSILGIARGLGLALGPLVGAMLLRIDFGIVALVAAGCFLVNFIVTMLFMPPVQVATERRGLTYGIGLALHDRRFVLFTFLLMGYWFMWVQMTLAIPLEARALSGTNDSVSWVYLLNAIMSIVLQYPVMHLAERWMRPLPILVVGMALMAVGLGSIALISGVTGLLTCVGLFSLGNLLAVPSQQTVAVEFANPAVLGSYFGVSALALAIGGGIGNYSGGLLYGLGRSLERPALPWLVFGLVGLLAAIGLVLLDRSQRHKVEPVAAVG